jgi:hypothetical protein
MRIYIYTYLLHPVFQAKQQLYIRTDNLKGYDGKGSSHLLRLYARALRADVLCFMVLLLLACYARSESARATRALQGIAGNKNP